ncbi:MAG: hypothetical protein LBS81_00100 [Endomicrobium sp.]|jgi:hypothetical protein|nr:hypothetical protein [Endomicrobium sp.]
MGQNLLSKRAEDNVIFMDPGIVMDKNFVVKYNFYNSESLYYIWNKDKNRKIKSPAAADRHKKLIKHYLSSIAISEYLIKNIGKQYIVYK